MKKFKIFSVSLVSFLFSLVSYLLPIDLKGYSEEKPVVSRSPDPELVSGEVEANLKGKECISIEADEMQRRYENKPLLFDNMFIFDIRPLAVAVKGKSIPFVKQTSWDMFRVKYLHNVPMWRGKDVYLVGEDTESTKSFCEEMIKKDYGVNDIYYLNGGIDAWNGSIRISFKDVQCEGLNSHEIKKRIDEGQKVYLIDWRYPDDFYNGGHIPGSINGYGREGIFGGIEDMLRGYFRFRPIYIKLITDNAIAVFIDNTEWKGLHRCRIEKRASGIMDKMYYLKGGIEKWEGPLEKEPWKQGGSVSE